MSVVPTGSLGIISALDYQGSPIRSSEDDGNPARKCLILGAWQGVFAPYPDGSRTPVTGGQNHASPASASAAPTGPPTGIGDGCRFGRSAVVGVGVEIPDYTMPRAP